MKSSRTSLIAAIYSCARSCARSLPAHLLSLALLIFPLFASPAQAAEPGSHVASAGTPVRDKWALIIGISKFKDPAINLRYSDKDASDFHKFLIEKANFAPDHVQTLINEQATRANILDYLGDKWLPRVAMPDDLVVIYVSSHGSPSHADVAGANYLVAHDTDPSRLFATGLSMTELASIIKERVHCDRVVIFLDACHSGGATAGATGGKGLTRVTNFDAGEIMQGTGQMVVCSSRANQTSWESRRYQNGVFTHYLMNSLGDPQTGARMGTAFESLLEHVQEEVLADRGELQTPVLKCKWTGASLALGCVPARPRAVPVHLGPPGDSTSGARQSIPVIPATPVDKSLPPYVPKLNALAEKLMRERRFDDALPLYEALRSIIESSVGRDTRYTTECLTQLGWLYSVKGRLADAASLQRESVRIDTTLYGENSFYVARELTLLCNTLLAQKDFVEAEPIALRAIKAWETLGGSENPNVLESLVNLASIRIHFNQLGEASNLLDRAKKLADIQHLDASNAHRQKLEHWCRELREAKRR